MEVRAGDVIKEPQQLASILVLAAITAEMIVMAPSRATIVKQQTEGQIANGVAIGVARIGELTAIKAGHAHPATLGVETYQVDKSIMATSGVNEEGIPLGRRKGEGWCNPSKLTVWHR